MARYSQKKGMRGKVSNIRQTVISSGVSIQNYSAAKWSTTDKTNITLSNVNKTATCNLYGNNSQVKSDLAITGSIYVEISARFGSNVGNTTINVGIKLTTDTSTTIPANISGQYSPVFNVNATRVYGISFNPTNGNYEIRQNNILVSSGTVTPSSNWRICFGGESDYGGAANATINTGATAFTYTPVYV